MDISILNLKIDISILKILFKFKDLFHLKNDIWILDFFLESKINISIPKLIDWVLKFFFY
jgi:hypothetical protein